MRPSQLHRHSGCSAMNLGLMLLHAHQCVGHPNPYRYNALLATHLLIFLAITMSLPLRSYFFSPLNVRINDSKSSLPSSLSPFLPSHPFSELQNHDQLLNVHSVEVQVIRLSDILTTFRMALYDQNKASLLLLAESLRVRLRFFPL